MRQAEVSLGKTVSFSFLDEDVLVAAHRRGVPQSALVVVVLGNPPKENLGGVRELASLGAHVVVVGPEKDADLILAAMRAGAEEYLVEGADDEIRQSVAELALRNTGRALGRVTCVYPAKGGVGATAIASNLAGALHRSGDERVCLIDLDLHFGDVLSFLDLNGGYSISDVIANIRRLDRELLDSSLTHHASGIFVIAQSEKIEQAEAIGSQDITTLLTFLRQHFDHVVVDGLRGLDDTTVAALDECNRVLLVLTQDVPAVRNAQRCISIFERLDYPTEKISLVVNRFQRNSKISTDVIRDTTGMPVEVLVANDFAALIKSINRGVLLADESPKSRLTKSIDGIVPLVRGVPEVAARRRGFFGGLLGRKAAVDGAQ
ncbi:MAG: hypothetical protein A2289_16110 [Deltaproteobacteria bacterium RIFOXYA12_FULL_58_15]|nr:MAG: hypothetical protein A2289_16110 [Deltaproteobacteria bacterium RIFOXYA12_FULL_58_15]